MTEVNILLGSGGRRNYLVRWFRDAMRSAQVEGNVCVIDANPHAPAIADADLAAVVPSFDSPDYLASVAHLCDEWNISLAFSLNDFESSLWAGAGPTFGASGRTIELITASPACQAVVEDKAAYHQNFEVVGVRTPHTILGSEALAASATPFESERIVIKHRYGSGSTGLAACSRANWRRMLFVVADNARDRFGTRIDDLDQAMDAVVLQEMIVGQEFGIDIVSDFDAEFQGVLARRKIRMRAGETDQAVSVDGDSFLALAERISRVTQHRGLMDADVMMDEVGDLHLIDVNPRFGGGYPFSHAAGANVPAAYLAWHLKQPANPAWLRCQPGVAVSKTEDIRVVSMDFANAPTA